MKTFLTAAIAAIALTACSGGGFDVATEPQPDGDGGTVAEAGDSKPSCASPTPKAAACSGKECGAAPDGCGGQYECGSCPAPMKCGGGADANKCGCTPYLKATACAGKECGLVPDGCGSTVACDACPAPLTCAGLGEPNKCGCKAKTKEEACFALECGSVSDGCGATVYCGSCLGQESCGYKAANQCDACDPTTAFTCPPDYPHARMCAPYYVNTSCVKAAAGGTNGYCCKTSP